MPIGGKDLRGPAPKRKGRSCLEVRTRIRVPFTWLGPGVHEYG